ncbi:hypothetical protein M422DRAFT_784295 [Sphaerobolus stellatus SS14]|uniref:Tyrosine specific protein phosphatases domain-containing protein n=1 Tax=Sphaerobolus stellatus (strain SS14) TaxID=990650 RepID=A0A0C9UVX8_SPHS4|nr:hypothetical protein M422DRAFT_784295 [Sphaerobolus stellatus SS14]
MKYAKVDTQPEDRFNSLTKAFGKLQIPIKRDRSEDQRELKEYWDAHICSLQSLFPNAAKILRSVQVPNGLTSRKRIQNYIRSITITPEGEPFLPQASEVMTSRLWISDGFTGTDRDTLSKLGITEVVCIGSAGYHSCCLKTRSIGHTEVHVPEDIYKTPIIGPFEDAINVIRNLLDTPKSRILLHCQRGSHWSSSVAIAVMMNLLGCNFQLSHALVRRIRPGTVLPPVLVKAIQEWWYLQILRDELPAGRGYRSFDWAPEKPEKPEQPPRNSTDTSQSSVSEDSERSSLADLEPLTPSD